MTDIEKPRCWVCGSKEMVVVREQQVIGLRPVDFSISDKRYGLTGCLEKCIYCGFIQNNRCGDVTEYYRQLEDKSYEEGRHQRGKQASNLLRKVVALVPGITAPMRLLDVGAGSGILVEQAKNMGIDAEGVEPSVWLCNIASMIGLKVHNGVLPHPDIGADFQVVTLIDVIEHVNRPLDLLRNSIECLHGGKGYIVIVTPDVSAFAARIMRWRWWHYRLAHIGYYSRRTLEILCNRAGLQTVAFSRPGWCFPLDYLLERALQYLPGKIKTGNIGYLKNIDIPLNLFDSMMLIARKG